MQDTGYRIQDTGCKIQDVRALKRGDTEHTRML